MVSTWGAADTRRASVGSDMLHPAHEGTSVEHVQRHRAQRGNTTDECQCHEHRVPAVAHRQPTDAVTGQYTAPVANAVDDARGGSAGLFAAEVEREGSSQE